MLKSQVSTIKSSHSTKQKQVGYVLFLPQTYLLLSETLTFFIKYLK